MFASSPRIPSYTSSDPLSRASTLLDFNELPQNYTPMPSPQAWLASSKRRTMPSLLDPPASPLDLLLPITTQLDDSQWNIRLSLLVHRYLREYGIVRADEIIEKAWKTLGLFCVGEEAKRSLEVFRRAFGNLSTSSRELQTRSLAVEGSPPWFRCSVFSDDSFNLLPANLCFSSYSFSSVDTLSKHSSYVRQHQSVNSGQGGNDQSQSSLDPRDKCIQLDNMSLRSHPRYMTPTAASRAQVSTPEPRAVTPPPSSSTTKRKAWMVSAAKRVGIVAGTPRSKKEGRIYKRMSPRKGAIDKIVKSGFQDLPSNFDDAHISALPNERSSSIQKGPKSEQISSSPTEPTKDSNPFGPREKPNPPDKPLPSLPIATIQKGSPTVRRSLIDASEKPLRRSTSPSPGGKAEEDWPVLSPSRSTTPVILSQTARHASLKQANDSIAHVSAPSLGLHRSIQIEQEPQNQGQEARAIKDTSSSQEDETTPSIHQRTASDVEELVTDSKVQIGNNENEPPLFLPAAKDSPPPAAAAHPVRSCDSSLPHPSNSISDSGLSDDAEETSLETVQGETASSPILQITSVQRTARARPSRLPKRRSGPGPIRRCNTPPKNSGRKTSPFGSAATSTSSRLSVKHELAPTAIRRPLARSKHQCDSRAVKEVNDTSKDVPGLIAVRPSSRNGRGEGQRSSIPRRRNQFQLYQDADSESEVIPSKLPRKTNSNRMSTGGTSEEGDIGTDEEATGKLEPKAEDADSTSAMNPALESLSQLRADAGLSEHVSTAENMNSSALFPVTEAADEPFASPSLRECPIAGPAADLISSLKPPINAARQGAVTDKSFDRVKRLSGRMPEHGATLRISDSADRIIMGYDSDDSDDYDSADDANSASQKRHSVPDLRRSVVIKELRKSTGGLINGVATLSRSFTTSSLSRHDLGYDTSEAGNIERSGDTPSNLAKSTVEICDSKSEELTNSSSRYGSRNNTSETNNMEQSYTRPSNSRKPTIETAESKGEDPFVSSNTNMAVNPDKEDAVTADPTSSTDWPLRSPDRATDALDSARNAARDETPWISPLPALGHGRASAGKSLPPINASSRPGSARNRLGPQYMHNLSSEPVSSRESGLRPVGVHLSAKVGTSHHNAPFPPRTSSRSNTPDVSSRLRAQISHLGPQNIPNRFDSVRAGRPLVGLSMPREVTLNPANEPTPTSEVKGGKLVTSTPVTRDAGRGQLSSAKGMLSNIKGLFHKRMAETPTLSSMAKNKDSVGYDRPVVAVNGSPFPNYASRTLPADYGLSRGDSSRARVNARPRAAFQPLPAPASDDFRHATDVALGLLDAAWVEDNDSKRARLLQLGQLMVDAVTGGRDAEKAMEEAKQAAGRAEMHCMKAKKSVWELTRLVEQGTAGDEKK